jgi:hypothetical protein
LCISTGFQQTAGFSCDVQPVPPPSPRFAPNCMLFEQCSSQPKTKASKSSHWAENLLIELRPTAQQLATCRSSIMHMFRTGGSWWRRAHADVATPTCTIYVAQHTGDRLGQTMQRADKP